MVSGGGGGAVADVGVGGAANGPGFSTSQCLKKGPWTAAEDAILMEYVKKHGEGNWNAVQKNSGLMRCGKSCRLRWANHLRPNLKKGSFSPEEERIIIELHAKLGNKWARMAAQLPGRTDNEIKNYWNTRMKRRQRAGLPIYPQEVQEKAAAFHIQQEHHHHHHHKRPPHNNSSPSLSSLLTSQNPTYNPSLSLFNTFNFSSPPNHPLQQQPNSHYSNPNHQFKLFCNNNNNISGGFSVPLTSSTAPYPPPSAGVFSQNSQTQRSPFQNFKFDSGDGFGSDMSFSSMIVGAAVDPNDFVSGQSAELPSSQTPPQPTTPSSGSSGGGGVCVMLGSANRTNNNNIDYRTGPPKAANTISNSGLLDALVQESNNLSRTDQKLGSENDLSGAAIKKGKGVADLMSSEEGGVQLMLRKGGDANGEKHWENLSSSQSSIGHINYLGRTRMKPSEEPMEEMNSMDEDLMSLLNNFPLSMPLPEWYPAGGSTNISNASSSSITAGSNVESTRSQPPNVPPTPPPPPPPSPPAVSSPEIHWNQLGSYSWNNMPGIC